MLGGERGLVHANDVGQLGNGSSVEALVAVVPENR